MNRRKRIRSTTPLAVSRLVAVFVVVSATSFARAAAPAGVAPPLASPDAWPLFRGNPLAQGVSTTTLPDSPELVWQKQFPECALEASAVIHDGTIYLGTNNNDVTGDFYALSLADGAEKWKFHSDGGFSSAAGIHEGRVFVGNFEGRCYCLNAADGKAIWGYDTNATVHGGPNFYKDKVLFTSEDGSLYCLTAADGKLAWQYTINEPLYCSPTVVENRVFLGGCDSKFHVVDLDTGTAVSVVDIGAQTGNAPAVLGDRVFFGTLGNGVLGIDWKTSKILWTFTAPRRRQEYKSSAALAEGLVVLGCNDRKVYAVHAADGTEAWNFAAKGNIESSPVIVGSRVYVGSTDGKFYGLDLKTGVEAWSYESGAEFVASPAVAAGRMVVGDMNGQLYCFGGK